MNERGYIDPDSGQGCVPTKVCLKFGCQSFDGNTIQRPALKLRGKYWTCPRCNASYGEEAKGHR